MLSEVVTSSTAESIRVPTGLQFPHFHMSLGGTVQLRTHTTSTRLRDWTYPVRQRLKDFAGWSTTSLATWWRLRPTSTLARTK